VTVSPEPPGILGLGLAPAGSGPGPVGSDMIRPGRRLCDRNGRGGATKPHEIAIGLRTVAVLRTYLSENLVNMAIKHLVKLWLNAP